MPRILPALLIVSLLLAWGSTAVHGQEASPAASSAAMGSLLTTLVDRAELPGAAGFLLFGRNIAQPGARHTYAAPGEKGTIVIVVEAGELTYTIAGPGGGRILRGASGASPTEEPAPVGAPFTLTAGDALVYPAQKRVEANTSGAPTRFLFAVALEPVGGPPPDPTDVGEVETTILGSYNGPWLDLPAGAASLELRRTAVAPGAWLPVVPGGVQAVGQDSGDVGALLVGGDGAAFNSGTGSVDALVFTVVSTTPVNATPAPAAASPAATAGAAIAREPVATVTLVKAGIPAPPAVFDAWLTTWGPGDSYETESYGTDVNIAADLVLDGAFVVHSKGRMQAQRHGTITEIAPGNDLSLGPGEAAVYVENSAAQGFRNPGQAPTTVLSFGIIPVGPPNTDYPGVVARDDWQRTGLGDADVAVTATRITLPPGSQLPIVPDPAAPSAYAVVTGSADWVLSQPDGVTPTLRFFSGQVIPYRALHEGESLALRNGGTEPLVLVQLTPG